MITCMSDILCVTNRRLCEEEFLTRIEKIAAANPAGIILREKDLDEAAYAQLAQQVMNVCERNAVPCILHSFPETAVQLGCTAIHLPLPILRSLSEQEKQAFSVIGASCHSVEDAVEAQTLGCTYITAGHVFDTDCKKGLPGRGLDFLQRVCAAVNIPVYAIGGISAQNVPAVRAAGAAGACVMSGAMRCTDASQYLAGFEETV